MYLFVYRLDENVAGIIEEGEFVEPEDQDQGHFAEQGKLFSELALQTYASTFITCFTLKARFIKPISKVYGNYFATYVEI